MATTEHVAAAHGHIRELAKRHLWMHFSRLGGYTADAPVHVIARGEGCSLWDATGHRLLDGLSGLFTVQVGHGRRDLAEAARVQAETLDYFHLVDIEHPDRALPEAMIGPEWRMRRRDGFQLTDARYNRRVADAIDAAYPRKEMVGNLVVHLPAR